MGLAADRGPAYKATRNLEATMTEQDLAQVVLQGGLHTPVADSLAEVIGLLHGRDRCVDLSVVE